MTKRLNPALTVGTERTLRPPGTVRLYHTANLGFFQHYWWMTGVFVNAEIGIGRALPLGLSGDLRVGVGYLHYFWRRKTLKLEDGEYVPAKDWGRPSVMIPMSVVLRYRGRTADPLTVSPFVSAQWVVQTPFIEDTPAMTHLLFLVGVRIDRGVAAAPGGAAR